MSNIRHEKKYCLKPDKLYSANGCGSMGIFKTLLKSGLREARVHNCTIGAQWSTYGNVRLSKMYRIIQFAFISMLTSAHFMTIISVTHI